MTTHPEGRGSAGPGGPRTGRCGGEHFLPPVLTVAVAATVYGLLPKSMLFLPRLAIPALELMLVLAVVAGHRHRTGGLSRFSRSAALVLATVIIGTNLAALGFLVAQLGSDAPPEGMLLGAMQVWLTNVIGFGLLFWELDRGGPVARHTWPRDRIPLADFRFSQDENADAVSEVAGGSGERSEWMPELVDYLYVSLTNSSAFSPTDTMPLSSRAKMLMGLEATAALLTSLLVVARAVGSLGGG